MAEALEPLNEHQALNEDILLLRMLSAEPSNTGRYPFHDQLGQRQSLSFQREKDLVGALAFLSATSEDPEKVTAVCIEEDSKHEACTIRLASNKGNLTDVVDGFKEMASILQKAGAESHTSVSKELFEHMVKLNRKRILSRLRSKHAKKSLKSTRPSLIRRLSEISEKISTWSPPQELLSEYLTFQSTVRSLKDEFARLEALPRAVGCSDGMNDLLLEILKSIDDLPSDENLEILLDHLPKDSNYASIAQSCLMAINKLGKYRSSCEYLVKAAEKTDMLRRISVSKISICKSIVQNREFSLTRALRRMNVEWTPVLEQRFGVARSPAQDGLRHEMELLKPKIHAEIQLLFFYECNPSLPCPRVICATKSACFLCDMFIRIHGRFHIAKTHGVLYPKWTLPSLNSLDLDNEKRLNLQNTIAEFHLSIQHLFRAASKQQKLRPKQPNESVVSIRQWLSSTESVRSRNSHLGLSRLPAESTGLTVARAHSNHGHDQLEIDPMARVGYTEDGEMEPDVLLTSLCHSRSMSGASKEASVIVREEKHRLYGKQTIFRLNYPSLSASALVEQVRNRNLHRIKRGTSLAFKLCPFMQDTVSVVTRKLNIHFSCDSSLSLDKATKPHKGQTSVLIRSFSSSTAEWQSQLTSKTSNLTHRIDINSIEPGKEIVIDLKSNQNDINGFYLSDNGGDHWFISHKSDTFASEKTSLGLD